MTLNVASCYGKKAWRLAEPKDLHHFFVRQLRSKITTPEMNGEMLLELDEDPLGAIGLAI